MATAPAAIRVAGRPRFGGASQLLSSVPPSNLRATIGWWLLAVISGTAWSQLAWSGIGQAQHVGSFTDFTTAILNAGGQQGPGGITHLYAGNGSILVALPAFQLFLDALVRILLTVGVTAPYERVLVAGGAPVGNVVTGLAWPTLIGAGYLLGIAALFPLTSLSRRIASTRWQLALATPAIVAALWWMCVIWGHPDDALALGLLVVALERGLDEHWTSAAWWFGAAVAVQPLVLLGLPVLLALITPRSWKSFLVRAVVPGILVLAIPLVGDPHDTIRQVMDQPTYLVATGHPTPWSALVPHPMVDVVYGGWPRLLAIGGACLVGSYVRRRAVEGRLQTLTVVWCLAVCLSLRVAFEAVVFPYYIVPSLVLLIVAASGGGRLRFFLTTAAAAAWAAAAQWPLQDHTVYWACLVAAGLLVVRVARPPVLMAPSCLSLKRAHVRIASMECSGGVAQ